jgi:tRNA U34 5-methylaminomethyl-2-thiouridine-forming methyltransferase MnmC
MNIPSHLVNEHYDDRYFDVVSALEEAKLIYFKGCDVLAALTHEQPPYRIGETGFGAGRILVSLMDFLEGNSVTDTTIVYNSVELHPISSDRMAAILEGFRPEACEYIDLVVQAYGTIDIQEKGWHTVVFNRSFGSLTLNLWIGEALEMVDALEFPCNAWFLDGHGPKKNPDIWRPELLTAVGTKTVKGGTCATFTVAGAVRRALDAAGFTIEKVQGYGGKNSVLRGVKR